MMLQRPNCSLVVRVSILNLGLLAAGLCSQVAAQNAVEQGESLEKLTTDANGLHRLSGAVEDRRGLYGGRWYAGGA
jgi:hypothetical protein